MRLAWVEVVMLGALVAGCGAGWRRAGLESRTLGPRQQVQVWRAGERAARQWHAVIVTPDTISGIPYLRAVSCDSCRVRIPRAQVDSIRLGDPVAGFWKTAGLVVAVPMAFFMAWCIDEGWWPRCYPTRD